MRYYIIAGEASGDLHASNLMKEIKLIDSKADFRLWGGDLMKSVGGEPVNHYKDRAYMGFVEVLANLRKILNYISLCRNDILEYNPDAVILVDYPGFNLRIAEFAKEKGFKVYYYISPQVWAWRQSRVKKIRKVVDKMFVILPFEEEFYKSHNYKVDFVGHPLLDEIDRKKYKPFDALIKDNKLDGKPVIALLPGSRKQEISKILPGMLSVIPYFEGFQFVIAGASSINSEFYENIIRGYGNVRIIFGQTYDLLNNAKAALVTSGTATLETALFEVPEVVCYNAISLSYLIAKSFIKVRYISLVNLIMNRKVVAELIQQDFNTNNIKQELGKLLYDKEHLAKLSQDYKELKIILGGSGASRKTAQLITEDLKKAGGVC